MDILTYQQQAMRTLKMLDTEDKNDQHMLLGMMGELGELADTFKRTLAYDAKFDVVNVKEELGDLLWYWINLCTLYLIDPEEVMELNIKKLLVRFPEAFSEELAIKRNTDAERKVLEELGY